MSTNVRPARTSHPGGTRPPRPGRLVPDQHGAWAFLLLPVLLTAPVTAWHTTLVPVVLAWVAAYPAAWALTGRLTAPRPERFDRALRLWLPLAGVAAAVSLWWRPWLVWVGALYGLGYAVSLTYAHARRERALGNDLVLVAQCALMVPVLVGTGAGVGAGSGLVPPWSALGPTVGLLTAVCALALVGSTLHVKSLIRERHRPGFARASLAFAVACLGAALGAAALGVGPAAWLVVPAALAVARSLVVPGRSWRPGRIGMVELALLLVVAAVAWGV